jgi:chromosome partitioning protein
LLIVTFASFKGGVGKSTACASLGGAFAAAGQRVHIIDLDANHTVQRWLSDEATRPPLLTVSAPNPQLFTEHLRELVQHYAPDVALIDVAGSQERALTYAVLRANLTIIPAATTEADIFEAARTAQHIQTLFAALGHTPLYRVLVTKVPPLLSHARAYGFKELARLKLPLFRATLGQRAAFEEMGLGALPHFADRKRPTAAKAVAELDKLRAEIEFLLSGAETQAEEASPLPSDAQSQESAA